jgi:hypothetical protein
VPRRYFKIALCVLLVGLAAFVIDVLSPATPMPHADMTAKLLPVALVVLVSHTFGSELRPEIFSYHNNSTTIPETRRPRAKLVWLRVFLQ